MAAGTPVRSRPQVSWAAARPAPARRRSRAADRGTLILSTDRPPGLNICSFLAQLRMSIKVHDEEHRLPTLRLLLYRLIHSRHKIPDLILSRLAVGRRRHDQIIFGKVGEHCPIAERYALEEPQAAEPGS